SMLSDYTGMWLLYLGILFLITVLFVPMGLAGILMLHAPAWRSRRIGRLVVPYLVTGALGLVAVIGAIGLLELLHFVAVSEGAGATKLFWVTVAPRTPTPWLGFAALAPLGRVRARRTAPRAAAAFAEASK